MKVMLFQPQAGLVSAIRCSSTNHWRWFDRSVRAGFLRPLDEGERQGLAEMSWLIALFWINYLEVSGEKIDESSLERGIAMSRMLIEAFRGREGMSRE